MNRREAREQAFVLVFERSINHDTTDEIIEAAQLSNDLEVDGFARKTAVGIEKKETEIDARIEANTRSWKMSRLSKVALSLLRLAIYEMVYVDSIPVSVSINEAIDLAKKYGGADDAPFVNGVLGAVAKDLEKEKNA